MMKIVVMVFVGLLFSCMPDLPEFERIDGGRLRVLAVIYSPAPEYAPGDTVVARVYFAGKGVTNIDGYRVSYDKSELDTFINQKNVAVIGERRWFPDSAEVSFVVPESLLFDDGNSAGVPDEIVHALHAAAKEPNGCLRLRQRYDTKVVNAAMSALLRQAALFFKARSGDGTTLNVQSRFMVRYAPRLGECANVNQNPPPPKKVSLYSVEGDDLETFDPGAREFTGKYTSQLIFSIDSEAVVTETLMVVNGRSYFIAADPIEAETYENNRGRVKPEIVKYTYLYETDRERAAEADSVVSLVQPTSPIARLRVHDIAEPCRLRVWLVIHDDCNDAVRAKGFSLTAIPIVVVP